MQTVSVIDFSFQRPRDKIEEPFKDKKPHLYTLILYPDNTFEIQLDHEVL